MNKLTKTIIFALLLISTQVTAKSEIFFNDFNKFIKIEGKFASGYITCQAKRNETYFYMDLMSSANKPEKISITKELGHQPIFLATYRKNGTLVHNRNPAILQKTDRDKILVKFIDSDLTINLQLTDPKMPVIKSGDLPKGSKYTRVAMDEGEGFLVTAPHAVYLWENDNENSKLLCDIQTETD